YLYHGIEEKVQPNHPLTPDAIGYCISNLLQLVDKELIRLLNPGSGNAHHTMPAKEQLEDTELFVVEVDPLLAQVNVNLCDYLEVPMDIYPQNIIEPVRLPQVDAAIGDFPVGYYPLEVEGFTTAFQGGRSYAHLLMLESAMSYVKDDG